MPRREKVGDEIEQMILKDGGVERAPKQLGGHEKD